MMSKAAASPALVRDTPEYSLYRTKPSWANRWNMWVVEAAETLSRRAISLAVAVPFFSVARYMAARYSSTQRLRATARRPLASRLFPRPHSSDQRRRRAGAPPPGVCYTGPVHAMVPASPAFAGGVPRDGPIPFSPRLLVTAPLAGPDHRALDPFGPVLCPGLRPAGADHGRRPADLLLPRGLGLECLFRLLRGGRQQHRLPDHPLPPLGPHRPRLRGRGGAIHRRDPHGRHPLDAPHLERVVDVGAPPHHHPDPLVHLCGLPAPPFPHRGRPAASAVRGHLWVHRLHRCAHRIPVGCLVSDHPPLADGDQLRLAHGPRPGDQRPGLHRPLRLPDPLPQPPAPAGTPDPGASR